MTIVRLDVVIEFANLTDLFVAAADRIRYAYWGVIEVMTAIMCANLPAMSAFLRFVGHEQKSSPSTSVSHQYRSSSFSSSSSFPKVLRHWFNKSLRSVGVATGSGSRGSSGSHSGERSTTDFHEKKDVSDFSDVTYLSSPIKGGRSRTGTGTDKANLTTTTTTTTMAYNGRSDSELTRPKPSAGRQDGIYRTDEVEVESSLV